MRTYRSRLADAAHAEYVGHMRIVAAVVLVLALVVAADAADAAPRPRLKAFDSCTQLVDYARAGALRTRRRRRAWTAARRRRRSTRSTTPPITPPPTHGRDAPTSPTRRRRCRRRAAPARRLGPGLLRHQRAGGSASTSRTSSRPTAAGSSPSPTARCGWSTSASGAVTGTLALDGFGHRLLLRGDRVLAIAAKGDAGRDAGRPAGRADDRAAGEHDDRHRDRRLAPRRRCMRTMEVAGPLRRRAPERRASRGS